MRPRFAYVGCFTTEKRRARGKGIAVFRIDPDNGAWQRVEECDDISNPHFLALDRSQRFLYSAHGDSSETGAYARNPETGKLRFLNSQQTGGDNSSTVTTDACNRFVVLANGPGVAVFPIRSDGSLGSRCELVIPPGEQHGPHPHQAIFDPTGRFLVVPDKGLDKIHVYRFDAANGKLASCEPPFVKARYGAIPRHIAFHPRSPFAYCVNEMDSTVNAYRWDSERGVLEPFQRIATTPESYVGDNTGAEIAMLPSGRFLYASNRGHDSIVIYAVDPQSGRLAHLGWQSVQGRKPRFFGLDPDAAHLYACNENSHTIVEFRLDQESGALTPTGQVIETGSPSCIVFAA
jgi:6-phosphogluconolactonase